MALKQGSIYKNNDETNVEWRVNYVREFVICSPGWIGNHGKHKQQALTRISRQFPTAAADLAPLTCVLVPRPLRRSV